MNTMTMFDRGSACAETTYGLPNDGAGAFAAVSAFPLFHYEPRKIGQRPFGAITVAHETFHKVDDADEFYKAMGYDEVAKNKGLSGEEFLWDRYTRDNAKMSRHCLQVQIQAYLYKHSAEFRALYGSAYKATTGECQAVELDAADRHCAHCLSGRSGNAGPKPTP